MEGLSESRPQHTTMGLSDDILCPDYERCTSTTPSAPARDDTEFEDAHSHSSSSSAEYKCPSYWFPTPDITGLHVNARTECPFPMDGASRSYPTSVSHEDKCPSYWYSTPDITGLQLSALPEGPVPMDDEPSSHRSSVSQEDKCPPCWFSTPDITGLHANARLECPFPMDRETRSHPSSSSEEDKCPSYCLATPDITGLNLNARTECPFPVVRDQQGLNGVSGVQDASALGDHQVQEKATRQVTKRKAKKKSRPRTNRREFHNKKYREVLVVPLLGYTFAEAKNLFLGSHGANIKWIGAQVRSASVSVVDIPGNVLQILVGARYKEAFDFVHRATTHLLNTIFPHASFMITPLGQQGLATLASHHLDCMLKDLRPQPSSSSAYPTQSAYYGAWQNGAYYGYPNTQSVLTELGNGFLPCVLEDSSLPSLERDSSSSMPLDSMPQDSASSSMPQDSSGSMPQSGYDQCQTRVSVDSSSVAYIRNGAKEAVCETERSSYDSIQLW